MSLCRKCEPGFNKRAGPDTYLLNYTKIRKQPKPRHFSSLNRWYMNKSEKFSIVCIVTNVTIIISLCLLLLLLFSYIYLFFIKMRKKLFLRFYFLQFQSFLFNYGWYCSHRKKWSLTLLNYSYLSGYCWGGKREIHDP